jgi:hypothetical protein
MSRERIYRVDAVVLKRTDIGEADRLLTIYTPTLGKLRVTAKGVAALQKDLPKCKILTYDSTATEESPEQNQPTTKEKLVGVWEWRPQWGGTWRSVPRTGPATIAAEIAANRIPFFMMILLRGVPSAAHRSYRNPCANEERSICGPSQATWTRIRPRSRSIDQTITDRNRAPAGGTPHGIGPVRSGTWPRDVGRGKQTARSVPSRLSFLTRAVQDQECGGRGDVASAVSRQSKAAARVFDRGRCAADSVFVL